MNSSIPRCLCGKAGAPPCPGDPMNRLVMLIKPIVDFAVTLLLWCYHSLYAVIFVVPRYFPLALFASDREAAFQSLSNQFYRIFFAIARRITPGLEISIPPEVRDIRSSVIVCNHISYLDPILLVSLFKKQKTIVKETFFSVPIFGAILKGAGYIPAATDTSIQLLMVERIQKLKRYLAQGGIIFIFPEGTRSRTGRMGEMKKGAFSIARLCEAPIELLFIKNTNRLFRPGSFLFNTCVKNTIEIERLGRILPDYHAKGFSISRLRKQIQAVYNQRAGSIQG